MLPILEMWLLKNRLLKDALTLKHFQWTKPQGRGEQMKEDKDGVVEL